MPLLDLSEVLLDPTFTDASGAGVQVIRRLQTVGANGVMTTTNAPPMKIVAVVYTSGDNSLVRQDAYQVQGKSIDVVTRFRLRGASQDSTGAQWQPDLVLWRGDYYVVRDVQDYGNFGSGFVQAACASIDLVDQPPS